MKVKRSVLWLVVAILVSGCTGSFTTEDGINHPENEIDQKKLVLKLAHTQSASVEDSALHSTAVLFQEALSKYGIELQIYPAGQLGDNIELSEGLRQGTIDFVVTGTGTLTSLVPKVGILDLPYIWKDYDHVHRVLDGKVGDDLAQSLLAADIRVLCWTDTFGFRNVGTVNKSFANIGEVERLNLKIRTIESETYINAVRHMGMTPVPMGFVEIDNAMQVGIIDGFEHDAATTYSHGFSEVISHYMLTEHTYAPICIFVSDKVWKKISEEDKDSISVAAIHAGITNRTLAEKKDKQMIEKLKNQGVNIVEVDKSGFIKTCEAYNKKFAKENDVLGMLGLIMQTE